MRDMENMGGIKPIAKLASHETKMADYQTINPTKNQRIKIGSNYVITDSKQERNARKSITTSAFLEKLKMPICGRHIKLISYSVSLEGGCHDRLT